MMALEKWRYIKTDCIIDFYNKEVIVEINLFHLHSTFQRYGELKTLKWRLSIQQCTGCFLEATVILYDTHTGLPLGRITLYITGRLVSELLALVIIYQYLHD